MFDNLRAEMTRKHVTNEQLAKVIGVHPSTVSNKLNRYDGLKISECFTIRSAFFLDLSIDYLFSIDTTNKTE